MVRDFCIRQAERKKFLLSVVDYLPSPILRNHFLPRLLKNHDRLSVTSHDLDLIDSMRASSTHSIICIPQRGYKSVDSVCKFSSLKVFHVLRINNHPRWHPGDRMFDLIYLTYLASHFLNNSVPSAISNLRNLQTLIVYGHQVRLPVKIWSLRQLKHLIAFSFLPLPIPEGKTYPLKNLETISMATNLVCSEKMVEMIPNIKKLGIRFSIRNSKKLGWSFGLKEYIDPHKLYKLKEYIDSQKLYRNLCQLEELKLENFGYVCWGQQLNPVFPRSLKKLTLCGWGVPWEEMTNICFMSNLQVLKLRNYACSGKRWKTIGGKFGELRLLLIGGSTMQAWETESSHFPKLECLKLYNCPNLYEIPSEIGDIATLKLIEVDMHLLESAKNIQQRSGNHSFQIRTKNRS